MTRLLFAKPSSAKPASSGTSYPEEGVGTPEAAHEAIDAYIEKQMARLKMPGVSLAIVEGDQIKHLRGFGRARPGGAAPTPQTPFPIASLTKSFTAMAIKQLVETGKIELDAPVQRYLPWFRVADPQASAQITVRHLLNQTSGLPTSAGETFLADFDSSPGALERHARALSTLVLSRAPGSAFEYSNANYLLLGLVLEAASGESYADYVQKHILIPLGMSRSTTSRAVAQVNGLAMGHQYWFGLPRAVPNLVVPPAAVPGGGLFSSAEDMARYMIAHLNGGRYGHVQILSPAGIAELHRGAADVLFMGKTLGQYGMGWYAGEIAGTKLVWHSGTLPDFFSYMALLPEQKKGVVLLFNADHHWMNPVLTEVGTGVATLLAGGLPQPVPIPFVRFIPWALRGQVVLPVLQMAGLAATLRQLRRWRLRPQCRPSGGDKWGRHVLRPLIHNLLLALTLKPVLGKRRGYLRLYMPDMSLLALVCGSLALVWSVMRTGLVLRALRKTSPSRAFVGRPGGEHDY